MNEETVDEGRRDKPCFDVLSAGHVYHMAHTYHM